MLLLAVLALATVGAASAAEPVYVGMSLSEALQELRERGLKIVFSTGVVGSDMRVESEPEAGTPRQILEQLLAPHGLTARGGPGGTLVVVPRSAPPPAVAPPPPPRPGAELPVIQEELKVTPSRLSLMREQPVSPLAVSRDEILALPHLGDDFFRALTLLPGTSANDVSAQFHVRGGRRDETQILIDGQELYEAYHLKDFDGALSFVASAALASADLTTGGFPAQYGDRMSGVLDMTTVEPRGAARYRLGAGVTTAHAGGAGGFGDGRGSWLLEARRGAIDLVAKLLGDEDPRYWDAFGKVDYAFSPRHSVQGNLLLSHDSLDFEETIDGERKLLSTDYGASYFWLTWQALAGDRLVVESAASFAAIDRDRSGIELEDDLEFTIFDERDLDVFGLRQNWTLDAGRRHTLSWGWRLSDFTSAFDYFGARQFDNPLAAIRHDGGDGETAFANRFEEQQRNLFGSDRWRPTDSLSVELGLRYDEHPLTDESHVSPRLNLAWTPVAGSVVRAAWGRFNQSQRPYELQVEDGESAFRRVERSVHRVLGFEHLFDRGVALRVELYQREVSNPRPRFENLFEPVNTFPEVEPDRVLVVPDTSLAEGVELFVRGRAGKKVGWFANYTWSSTEDRVDGVWRPRLFDQEHAVNLDLDYRPGESWRFNLAWRFHTGWPTTPLTFARGVDADGETLLEPRLGPINSARLSSYHRADLRASRRWRRERVTLDLFIDIQNLYNRKNEAGFDVAADDDGEIVISTERWSGFLPSIGLSVEF